VLRISGLVLIVLSFVQNWGKALEVQEFMRVIVVELGRFWRDKNLSLFHNLVVVSILICCYVIVLKVCKEIIYYLQTCIIYIYIKGQAYLSSPPSCGSYFLQFDVIYIFISFTVGNSVCVHL
jgi:hypothetical protein